MNREIPIINRVLYKKEQERVTDLHLSRIMSMKFSNISFLNKNKNESQSTNKVKHDYSKLAPLEGRGKRVKTLLNDDRIRSQNKNMYGRLVNQKATLSSKIFAEQRHRNIQFLKRIGRYPYKPGSTSLFDPMKEEQLQNNVIQRSQTFQNAQQVQSAMNNLRISLNSIQSGKYYQINSKIEEQQKKNYMILLWSKVIQLQKNWYTVKFLRFKSHYQIEVTPYPQSNTWNEMMLAEQIGTQMLSQNDYDYQYICTHFIKFTQQSLCFAFQLNQEKKKYFYKFQKKKTKNRSDSQSISNKQQLQASFIKKSPHRKTVFALQNEQNEFKMQSKDKLRRNTQNATEIQSSAFSNNQDILIDLSKR